MQDIATAHTANNSTNALAQVFGERVKSQGLWPARSPDLNPCNFYQEDKLKEVYVNDPHSPQELKENIWQEISVIPRQQRRHMSRNIFFKV
jgi:hypothetical protein